MINLFRYDDFIMMYLYSLRELSKYNCLKFFYVEMKENPYFLIWKTSLRMKQVKVLQEINKFLIKIDTNVNFFNELYLI